jgi:hypothetical protein
MLERRCALFGCNNSRIGTKITNSERRVAFNVASALKALIHVHRTLFL